MKNVITLLVVWFLAPLAYAQSAYVIAPGENAAEELQEALILAEEGDVIELEAGVFHIKHGLSLDNSGVTLMGQGMDKSILSFIDQTGGAEGLLVTGNEVILKDFAIEDASGDAIKAKGVNGIAMVRLRVEWTGGPKPENGAYGLYPVQSTNVYIEGCVAIGASDAGIYVGQSDKIITRNNRAEYNVAGLEIENSFNADVYDNILTNNTGGILVFDLPDLPQQGGHHVRVFNNAIYSNHTDNFAPEGNIVGLVPRGTGMLIMANTDVEVSGTISGTMTRSISPLSAISSRLRTKPRIRHRAASTFTTTYLASPVETLTPVKLVPCLWTRSAHQCRISSGTV